MRYQVLKVNPSYLNKFNCTKFTLIQGHAGSIKQFEDFVWAFPFR